MSLKLVPSLVCSEDCTAVERDCPTLWKAAKATLSQHHFINCSDTSTYTFPLPNCCISVGLRDFTNEGNLVGKVKIVFNYILQLKLMLEA